MSANNDGGPAFPGIEGESGYGNETRVQMPEGFAWIRHNQGMTLRDWFAGQAKISTHLIEQTLKANGENPASVTLERLFEVRADLKFKEADAMLRERARTKGTP